MTTTILTDEQIQCIGLEMPSMPLKGSLIEFARAIEQAVLQSPQVLQKMDDYAAAKVREAQQWVSVDERLPDVGVPVLVYTPNGPDDYPEDINIRFDYICPDYEYWHEHSEHYEHFLCVAKGGADCPMTGPSEKAPYTHWAPLPAPPQQ